MKTTGAACFSLNYMFFFIYFFWGGRGGLHTKQDMFTFPQKRFCINKKTNLYRAVSMKIFFCALQKIFKINT